MSYRDLLLANVPCGTLSEAVLVYRQSCGTCAMSLLGLLPVSSSRAAHSRSCRLPRGDAEKAPLCCGSAETSSVPKLVFSWSWETRAAAVGP